MITKAKRYLILGVVLIFSVNFIWLVTERPLLVAESINILFNVAPARAAQPGDLFKTSDISSVYYLGTDNKRYVFPSESVYFSWYKDFNSVIDIPASELQSYPLGGNVVMRAGTKLVKITTDPSVYAVEPSGLLRQIKDEVQAKRLYGNNWARRVADIPDAFFVNYQVGEELADDELPIGSLTKNIRDGLYYYYAGTAFHHITSAEAFWANRFYSEYILQIDQNVDSSGFSISDGVQDLLGLIQGKPFAANISLEINNIGLVICGAA